MTVSYRLLGPIEATRDGRTIDLGGPKQRAVLAVLLLDAGKVVATDRIIQAVWGDDAPASVVAGLHAYISNLRKALRDSITGVSAIVRRAPGYSIDVPATDIDIRRFWHHCDNTRAAVSDGRWTAAVSEAEQALAEISGPLAAEFADEWWVQARAAELRQREVACEQDLITALLGAGRVESAVIRAERLVRADALSEKSCQLSMIALYRAGRAPDALEAYRVFAAHLDDELGLEPGPELRRCQSEVLRQDPGLAYWPATVAPTPLTTTPPETMTVATPTPTPTVMRSVSADPAGVDDDFVGRRRELRIVQSVLEQARTRGPCWVVFTGEAGIGKSRLAEEAVHMWTAAGGEVMRTRCPDDESMPAWWPVRRLLADRGVDPDAVLTPPTEVGADEARFVVYDRIRAWVAAVAAQRPLLILVDDVHWADPASLRFMRYVAEAEQALPLAVVVTARDGAGGEGVQRLLAAVNRRPGFRQLALPPLNAEEVATLAGHLGSGLTAAETRDLTEKTSGNPFFVSEYARLPEAERRSGRLPVAVRSVLGRRLAHLDDEVLRVLRVAAVLGDPLDLDLLATVARLDRDDLDDVLDEAADEAIMMPAPGTGEYVFAHALLRDELVAGLSAPRRQRLHLQIAEAIGERAVGDRARRRAGHLMAALPVGRADVAVEAARAVAERAEADWQFDTATLWWENALRAWDLASDGRPDQASLSDRDDMAVAQVAALAHTGRSQAVLDTLENGLLDAVRQGRTAFVGRFAATLLRATGAWPWAVWGSDPGPLLTRLAGLESLVRHDRAAHIRVLATLAVGSTYDPDESVPDTLSLRALNLARELGDPDVEADALLGRLLTRSGVAVSAAETDELAHRLMALPHRLARVDEVLARNLLTMSAMTLGDMAAAADHVGLGAVGADLLRLTVSRVQFRWADGSLAMWRGDFAGAEQTYAHAFALHRQTELYLAGSHELARLSLRWGMGRPVEMDDVPEDVALPAWTLLLRADTDERQRRRLETEIGRHDPTNWMSLARLAVMGHTAADLATSEWAATLRTRLAPFAGRVAAIGQVGVIGPVDLALARLALLDDDLSSAREHLAAARAIAGKAGGRPELIRCRLVELQLDQRTGGHGSTDSLSKITVDARAAGIEGWIERARRL